MENTTKKQQTIITTHSTKKIGMQGIVITEVIKVENKRHLIFLEDGRMISTNTPNRVISVEQTVEEASMEDLAIIASRLERSTTAAEYQILKVLGL